MCTVGVKRDDQLKRIQLEILNKWHKKLRTCFVTFNYEICICGLVEPASVQFGWPKISYMAQGHS